MTGRIKVENRKPNKELGSRERKRDRERRVEQRGRVEEENTEKSMCYIENVTKVDSQLADSRGQRVRKPLGKRNTGRWSQTTTATALSLRVNAGFLLHEWEAISLLCFQIVCNRTAES